MGTTAFRTGLVAILLASGLGSGIADGIAAAPRDIQTASAMTAAEKAEGAKAHPELLNEFGGLYDGPQAAYVVSVGRRIAVQSSLSSQQGDFTISLLNSSVDNAFAIPGGYVYVTRQLMALMNDEAELAGVLGHEIGHVAAQHGKKRQSAATRNTILGVLGQVLIGQVAGNGALGDALQRGIGTGAQLLTLKFSRTQEYEADDLGIRYLAKAGYDPAALSSMLASLAAQTALDAQTGGEKGDVPEWASTHPDPASRVQRALATAQATGASSTYRNRAVFMSQLEGLIYGDDPSQGVVVGRRFLHPGLKLKFTAPAGYKIANQADAVTVSSSTARARFSGSAFDGDLDAHVQAAFAVLSGRGERTHAIDIQHRTVNGIPAAYGSANMMNQQGSWMTVTVFAYAFEPRMAYHFTLVRPIGEGIGTFSSMVESVSRMSDQEAAGLKPRRVHLVTVRAGDTPALLSRQMAYTDRPLERFLVLNGLAADVRIVPGDRVKLVTY